MRVIAGACGGRVLRVPATAAFRPTTDRVKESLFNILAGRIDWEGLHVCDLFAGSGGLGIEALSRGASRCTFVESSRASLAVLDRNLADLGLAARADVQRVRVEQFLRAGDGGVRQRCGLILADPPYRYPDLSPVLEGIARCLDDSGLAVLEHEGSLHPDGVGALRPVDRREYGTTAVTFFQLSHGGPA